ncbi:MAG: GNAT family N-acetyltransferase [Candidatus Delongbacteria bacterium]|nr:GNAT family N-acetyltransferase [Candidatus Delongbacteria bacterium]
MSDKTAQGGDAPLEFLKIEREADLPQWANRSTLERFLHDEMTPYQDPPEAIALALDDCFHQAEGHGGFAMLCRAESRLAGVCIMLRTGMRAYVPEWLLLMIGVESGLRGRGIGGKLARRCLAETGTGVKLHVEESNPARHLYERLGFRVRYAEMRYVPSDS